MLFTRKDQAIIISLSAIIDRCEKRNLELSFETGYLHIVKKGKGQNDMD